MSNDTEVKQKFSAAVGAVAGRDQVINNHNYVNTVEQDKDELKELLTAGQRVLLNNQVIEASKEFSSRFESVEEAKKDLWNYLRAKLHYEKGVATWFRHDYERAEDFIKVWRSNFENERKCSRLVAVLYNSIHQKVLAEKALNWFGEQQFKKLCFDELLKLSGENERLLGITESDTTDKDQEILVLNEELKATEALLAESRVLTSKLQKTVLLLQKERKEYKALINNYFVGGCVVSISLVLLLLYLLL